MKVAIQIRVRSSGRSTKVAPSSRSRPIAAISISRPSSKIAGRGLKSTPCFILERTSHERSHPLSWCHWHVRPRPRFSGFPALHELQGNSRARRERIDPAGEEAWERVTALGNGDHRDRAGTFIGTLPDRLFL